MRRKVNKFLYLFFKNEKFLQDYPIETKRFINFCKQRGIEICENDLEFLEKEKLFFPVFRIKLPKLIEKNGKRVWKPYDYKVKKGEKFIQYSAYFWAEGVSVSYLKWLRAGILFDPSKKRFQSWEKFKANNGEYGEKIISFYSSFQIDWLVKILQYYPPKFPTGYQEIRVKNITFLKRHNKVYLNANLKIVLDVRKDKIKKVKNFYKNMLKKRLSWKKIKQKLLIDKQEYDKKLRFLLYIQEVYYPFVKSGGKSIRVQGKLEKWWRKRYKFDTYKALNFLQLTINDVVRWYKEFSKNAHFYLGIGQDVNDWIQLWKNIKWDKKDKLGEKVRLGVDYLQWAKMLKRFIEDYEKKEILDIDEIGNIREEDILKFDIQDMELNNVRSYRNKWFYDPVENKNYYSDRIKRLYYLINDFGIDYQPRVMVFVEGKTEEEVFRKILKEWFLIPSEDLGIEFVNFEGVDKILSTGKTAEELRCLVNEMVKRYRKDYLTRKERKKLNELIKKLKKTDIIISNFQSFISYNLEKWQIIPFFVADNEGRIKRILDSGKIVKFENKNYDVPREWKFIWGISHKKKPFKGKDFEFANFSDEEIAKAIEDVIGKPIPIKSIEKIRNEGFGIKKISPEVRFKKIEIVKKLFDNLFEEYKITNDRSIIDKRPISELVKKITDLAISNYLPVNRLIELENKEFIRHQLDPNYKKKRFIR